MAETLHYAWHIPGWVIASMSFGAFVPAFFKVTASPGFYVLGTALLMGLGVWSFMAIVFRKLL